MQVLIELIAGFVALLAAFALSQFGVDLRPDGKPDREIQRVLDCGENPPPAQAQAQAMLKTAAPPPRQEC